MAATTYALEPFPSFIDAKKPSPYDHFSKMGVVGLLSPSSVAQLRKQQATLSNTISNHLRLRYHQYELTFGLYIMTPMEKLILNTIVLSILTALCYGLYIGFQPFLVRSICQLIYYIYGSVAGVDDICTEAACS